MTSENLQSGYVDKKTTSRVTQCYTSFSMFEIMLYAGTGVASVTSANV